MLTMTIRLGQFTLIFNGFEQRCPELLEVELQVWEDPCDETADDTRDVKENGALGRWQFLEAAAVVSLEGDEGVVVAILSTTESAMPSCAA